MKLLFKDFLKLFIILITWFIAKKLCSLNNLDKLSETLNYVPIHLIITLGYFAGMSVCFNVINIKNCDREHSELLNDISEARNFYEEKKIKYN